MGNATNKPVGTLGNWWDKLKREKTIMNGPQIAFNLSKDNQTVILFGENHKSKESCGEHEQFFNDLINQITESKECDSITAILELERSGRGAPRINNIYDSIDKNKNKDCKVTSFPANLIDINLRVAQLVNTHKYSDEQIVAIFPEVQELLSSTLKFFADGKSSIHVSHDYRSLSPEKLKIITPFINSIANKSKLCVNDLWSLTRDMPAKILRQSYICAFNVGIQLIDLYTLILILNDTEHKNIIVYEGANHIIFIVAFLMKHANYTLEDIAILKDENCVSFNDNNIQKGILSIKNFKRNDIRLQEHFTDNINIIEEELNKHNKE